MFVLSPTRSPGAKWANEASRETQSWWRTFSSAPVLSCIVNKVNCLSCGQPVVYWGGKCWNITKLAIIITYLTSRQQLLSAPGKTELITSLQSPHHWLLAVPQHISLHSTKLSPRPPANRNFFSFFFHETSFLLK